MKSAHTAAHVLGMVHSRGAVYVGVLLVASKGQGSIEVHVLRAKTGELLRTTPLDAFSDEDSLAPETMVGRFALAVTSRGAMAALITANGSVSAVGLAEGETYSVSGTAGPWKSIQTLQAAGFKGEAAAPEAFELVDQVGHHAVLVPKDTALELVRFSLRTPHSGVFAAASPGGLVLGARSGAQVAVRFGDQEHTWAAGSSAGNSIVAAWASVFARKHGVGVRMVAKLENLGLRGQTVLFSGHEEALDEEGPRKTSHSWSRDETLSAVTHTVALEAAPSSLTNGKTSSEDGKHAGTSLHSDPALSFQSRIQDQASRVPSALASFAELLSTIATNPGAAILRWAASSKTNRAMMSAIGLEPPPTPRTPAPEAYGFDKTLVMLARTSPSSAELVAVRAETGRELWRVPGSTLVAASSQHTREGQMTCNLIASRKHQAGQAAPEVIVVQSWTSGSTLVSWLDGWTGAVLRQQELSSQTSHVIALAAAAPELEMSTPILLLGPLVEEDGLVSVSAHMAPALPAVAAAIQVLQRQIIAHVQHPTRPGALVGLRFSEPQAFTSSSPLVMSESWRASSPLGSGFTSSFASLRPRDDAPPAPVGLPLGDDSVLIRYLSPHIIALVSESSAGGGGPLPDLVSPEASTFEQATADVHGEGAGAAHVSSAAPNHITVRLIDAVSGRTLFEKQHVDCAGPVHIVRLGNWVSYSYLNMRTASSELSVIAMFAGALGAHEVTPWGGADQHLPAFESSADRVEPQSVKMHTFILPRQPALLAASETRESITPQQVLLATESGSVMALPAPLLDPRRPLAPPSAHEKAEKLLQYAPFLPLSHEAFVTKDVVVPHITHLISTPTQLESTTLVVVCGLDIFAGRHHPVKAFDVLPEDFNAPLLIVLMVALAVGTVYLQRLLRSKQLRDSWK